MQKSIKVGWNKEYAKRVGKTKWVKNHIATYSDAFLSSEWDKLFPPKKEEDKKD